METACIAVITQVLATAHDFRISELAEVLTLLKSKGDDAGLYFLHRYATSTKVSVFQPR